MNASVHAPELETSLGWLNTDRALRFNGELRGQVVVLDFWTYCCINCIHILPDLAHLEEKYKSQPVTFVGVHSAKFANEASRETIRAAILRYEIKHPVVIDENMKIWRAFAARSWPTLVVIDAAGRVLTSVAGEGNRDALDSAIGEALAQGRTNGTLAGGPLKFRHEANVRAASGLSFPGKVLADAGTNRLYVADSNHNRIIIADMPDESGTCSVVKTVGSGRIGAGDGAADQSTFNHPQGMAVGQGNLYVADTENHLIRAIDLNTFEVTTIVGTGDMVNDRAGGLMGTQQGLNSPWDLALEGSTLYVAMAGVHQIWRIDLPVGFARAFAGSGRENIVDGPTESAALAQPSGICILGGRIYFADSEVSAIRGIDMASEEVFTLIGEGLFGFGDVDGVFSAAKLQHPLGVDGWNQSLVIADTYNHKIKLVEPAARSVRSLLGSGHPGTAMKDGGAAFFEPGGLSVIGNDAYVADTNNHRIVRANLETGAWNEIILDGLTHPSHSAPAAPTSVRAAPIGVAADRDIQLAIDISLPGGGHMNPEAPWSVRVEANGRTIVQHTGKSASMPLTVIVPAQRVITATTWHVMVSFAYCENSDRGICIPAEMAWDVDITGGGDKNVLLRGAIDA